MSRANKDNKDHSHVCIVLRWKLQRNVFKYRWLIFWHKGIPKQHNNCKAGSRNSILECLPKDEHVLFKQCSTGYQNIHQFWALSCSSSNENLTVSFNSSPAEHNHIQSLNQKYVPGNVCIDLNKKLYSRWAGCVSSLKKHVSSWHDFSTSTAWYYKLSNELGVMLGVHMYDEQTSIFIYSRIHLCCIILYCHKLLNYVVTIFSLIHLLGLRPKFVSHMIHEHTCSPFLGLFLTREIWESVTSQRVTTKTLWCEINTSCSNWTDKWLHKLDSLFSAYKD